MTVRDWIERRAEHAPQQLTQQVLAMLGGAADEDESRVADACLAAAARALEALVEARRFARDHAADLLAIDALTTFAFEHASEHRGARNLGALSEHGARMLGQFAAQRV